MVSEIEAGLPNLSPEELARVEATLLRLRHERGMEVRFDSRPWPANAQETKVLLAELDSLAPLLSPEEAGMFDTWLIAERERQKVLSRNDGERIRDLFS